MPLYKFEDTETGKVWEEFMSIDGREKYLEENPHIKQLVNWRGCDTTASNVKDSEMANVARQHYRVGGGQIQGGLKPYLPDSAREF
jgi:hypothetical protein